MPWSAVTVNDQREEFVGLAWQDACSFSELCRRFGVSRKTGYKWLARKQNDQLHDRSRRPLTSPTRTAAELEAKAVEVRTQHPAWGGRKIAHVLKRDFGVELAPSTVTSVLHRHGLISPEQSEAHTAWHRFEHPQPNDLWQIDFKGDVTLETGRCHPLTVIDDHSRFNLVLTAMRRQTREVVQAALTEAFERYGLPARINADNGPPWGSAGAGITGLGIWMVRLGILVSNSRPYHPQTNGKDERFHRTLLAEALAGHHFEDISALQSRLDEWRMVYNVKRPHQALAMKTPLECYRPSSKAMPKILPLPEYDLNDIVRSVHSGGFIKFEGFQFRISQALYGERVAIRPVADEDGVYDIFLCRQRVDRIDLRALKSGPT